MVRNATTAPRACCRACTYSSWLGALGGNRQQLGTWKTVPVNVQFFIVKRSVSYMGLLWENTRLLCEHDVIQYPSTRTIGDPRAAAEFELFSISLATRYLEIPQVMNRRKEMGQQNQHLHSECDCDSQHKVLLRQQTAAKFGKGSRCSLS